MRISSISDSGALGKEWVARMERDEPLGYTRHRVAARPSSATDGPRPKDAGEKPPLPDHRAYSASSNLAEIINPGGPTSAWRVFVFNDLCGH